MKIYYISYPLTYQMAPHQSMAAFLLAKMGHNILYFSWSKSKEPSWLDDFENIECRHTKKKGIISSIFFLKEILVGILKEKPDLVYIQGAQQTPFLLWMLSYKRIPVVYHTQDFLGPGQHYFYELCEKLIARSSCYVILNEPNRARFFASNYKLNYSPKIIRTSLPRWWPVPTRNEQLRSNLIKSACLEGNNRQRLIVAGGGYNQSRMSEQLLDAFNSLPENYALVFMGMEDHSDEYIACKKHMNKLKLDKRIIFLGSLPYSELLNIYAACDIGILLYPDTCIGHYYQAPGRLTEYLRCGLSIVFSNFPSLELLNLQHNLGTIADPYNPQAIAEAILSLGNINDAEQKLNRDRLILKANKELNYEIQAEKVLSEIIKDISTDVKSQ